MKRLVGFLVGICAVGLFFSALVSCGSGDTGEITSCSIARSELGPFSPGTPLGQSMSADQARARMAQDNIVDWIAVTATGPWDSSWDSATATLGESIHADLAWIDVDGEILGLYESGDAFAFTDLRVSRSFQGKIEHSDEPLYLPLQANVQPVNFDAECSITALLVGDAGNDQLLDVLVAASADQ